MADRQTPTPRSGGNGERRPASPRSGDYYNERPQTSHSGSGYGERPQGSRSGSGYSERTQGSRSGSGYSERTQDSRSSSGYGERRPSQPRSTGAGSRPSSARRPDVIRCENCGEDYSVTYKRCPFCDERPGRGGITGKRVANTRGGGYGRPVNPIQIAGLVVSLVLIAAALFIVFRFIGAPLFGGKKPPASSQGSSQSTSQGSSASGGTSTVTPPALQSIALSHIELTLDADGSQQLTASLLPAGATGDVTWSSSNETAATVDANGLVTNVNAGSSDVNVTITASCGDISAQAAVICKAKTGSGTVASGTTGRVVNAEKGLNIRSGPGRDYDKVASAKNNATVTILGEENGWYKIQYNGNQTGYVLKDYISVN